MGFNRDSRQQPANNIRTPSSRFTGLRADGCHGHFAAPNTAPVNPLCGLRPAG